MKQAKCTPKSWLASIPVSIDSPPITDAFCCGVLTFKTPKLITEGTFLLPLLYTSYVKIFYP